MVQISPIILALDKAQVALAAAFEKSATIGIPYTISVVDGTGQIVAVTRMDGAAMASIDTSLAKARASAYFASPTKDLAAAVRDGQPLATIQTATSIPLAFVAGGVPIKDSAGVVIGAIGAGGGSPQQDHEVAAAGAAAIIA